MSDTSDVLEKVRAWCSKHDIVMEIRSGERPKWRVWLNSNWGHACSDDLLAAVKVAYLEANRKLDAYKARVPHAAGQ